MSISIKKIFVMVYCVILFASLLIFNMIPNKNFIESNFSQQKSYYNSNNEAADFKQLVVDGKLSSSKEFIKKGSRSFTIKEQLLKFKGDKYSKLKVLVEHKKVADGKIDVIDYLGESMFKGIDIKYNVQPMEVKLVDDTLVTGKEADKTINISRFDNDITANQFINKQHSSNDTKRESFSEMPNVYTRRIIIKIPNNVKMDTTNPNVEMIR